MSFNVGSLITAVDWNGLVGSVNAEMSRRGGGSMLVPTVAYGGSITAQEYNTINNALGTAAYPYNTGLPNVAIGTTITATQVSGLLNAINSASGVCLCNCNYCTCNCNYCTCNCNYCTCNCNYCTCNCNYSCTCNCNYTSDERLKTDIEFIETVDGVNVYKWAYIWDKKTKYTGVLAQELLNTQYANAVVIDENGYFKVNYSLLPVDMALA